MEFLKVIIFEGVICKIYLSCIPQRWAPWLFSQSEVFKLIHGNSEGKYNTLMVPIIISTVQSCRFDSTVCVVFLCHESQSQHGFNSLCVLTHSPISFFINRVPQWISAEIKCPCILICSH